MTQTCDLVVATMSSFQLCAKGSCLLLIFYHNTRFLIQFLIVKQVINLLSIRPLDRPTINASVRKTNRLVTVEEGFSQHGVGAEIWLASSPMQKKWLLPYFLHQHDSFELLFSCNSTSVIEESFEYLDAPVERIAGADVPMPYAANLERMALPQVCCCFIKYLQPAF